MTEQRLQHRDGDYDVVIIGSGIGGLVAGALLARYGKSVVVCESHSIAGGAAHSFERQGFQFDSGPSFYCGLGDRSSINPLRQVLDVLGESLEAIAYDPLGHYHFPDRTVPIYGDGDRYRATLAAVTPQGAQEFAAFEARLLALYQALRPIPTLALRADWRLALTLLRRYPGAVLNLLPHLGILQSSVGQVMDRTVRDPWVRRLIDLECFLLSGLPAHGTIVPEMAVMLGERSHSQVDYPKGGSGAIVQALVRGLQRWGGELRLNTHVQEILVQQGRAVGVGLKRGGEIRARTVISNATIWDTYRHLLPSDAVPESVRQAALDTPAVDSFMHLHLGIRSQGLESLTGHHVVVQDGPDLTQPGQTCMISIPSVWDASLAPAGHHVIHAYTLESYEPWRSLSPDQYNQRKQDRAQVLYRALERVIPDLGDRLVLELIGTPRTHARFLRRHQGTYGPAIAADQGLFPSTHTTIPGLYRVGDSTLPGIGIPAVAASGILCANTLVSSSQTADLLAGLSS
ncbi:NAD(P)/FAD-dependent oxidoreductase [Leptolyngbya sp. CCY15150]|uniref:phytoene desaturase family protein n=1 Tax=Leptolyngbya sp. CCY15150 TaxID=2767772 RepID=UPI00195262C4|nr:NAD(P)/FAD-dependent oxidoreductase [Leptolyngbya sp. CCY15150]